MFVALKSRGSQLFRTTSEYLQANAFAHRCSCVGCNRLAFDILTSTNGDEPIADILPGCWSDRTTDAIDLQADQFVFNRRAAALPRCSLVTSTHTQLHQVGARARTAWSGSGPWALGDASAEELEKVTAEQTENDAGASRVCVNHVQ